MRHGSLFSGIGGFDLAAEWMGWTNVFHCEVDPFCNRVLNHHFPQSIGYENIKETIFSVHRGDIDILTGGFPCQPYSMAGRRLGKQDERHLWPEMLRAIREIEPTYVVGENVRGLLTWNEGVVLDEIYADLEAEGYEVGTFVLPAIGVDAPHKRDRVWIVASHANNARLQGREVNGGFESGGKERDQQFAGCVPSTWQDFPTQPPICRGDDGLPRELDNITFSKWRKESIKAYGNAIVPQVALQIFKAIASTYE